MVRGTGKFKQKRGGGRNFSKNMVLDENGTAVSTDKRWAPRGKGDDEDGSDEESEEESSEEESSEEEAPAASGSAEAQPELSRAERKEQKKKQAAAKAKTGEDEEDEDLINPNHVGKKLNISDLGAPRELSRREREQKEKQEAKDRYWKLHVAGKTDEAKADLGRLAKIRAEREAAAAKRKAETEAKAAEIAKAAAAAKR
ncbi:casein kinase substrate phosphoprotein PP28-domain-containing protein [Mycena albidolilacea]|uniref:Casein kinase substrate phosphoprotein PP28-domain-containing protein n=1 Tax=Mycena albidolilacea TaxID=1033008 RepID=A0AAD7AA83_9AGAR|nr:casein kinase substrate phosphoprotein PP28-domain-containing protein [Mycena albidolilacea]